MTFLPRETQVPQRIDRAAELVSGRSARKDGAVCQWIDGPVTGDDSCKCGKTVLAGLPGRAPYCAEHAGRCFESAAAWKARNAWLGGLDGSLAPVSLKDWLGDGE